MGSPEMSLINILIIRIMFEPAKAKLSIPEISLPVSVLGLSLFQSSDKSWEKRFKLTDSRKLHLKHKRKTGYDFGQCR